MLDGTPVSRYYKDTYRSVLAGSDEAEAFTDLGLQQSEQVFLKGAGLLGDAPLWRDTDHWSILETGFGLGLNFLSTWAHWLSLPQHLRPHRLTFVSIEKYPVLSEDILQSTKPFPGLAPLVDQLRAQWFGLVPGFHTLRFERGAIKLLLCVGEVRHALNQIEMRADSVFLDGFNPKVNPQMWSHTVLGRIAKLARPGTQLATWCVSAPVLKSLQIHGFECYKKSGLAPKKHRLNAVYNPSHIPPLSLGSSTSNGATQRAPHLGRCAVIGAGIAGASVAYLMAIRGWSVTVFDAAPKPAQGASGVPVGIFSTQVSADDNAASQLSRAGVRFTEQLLQETIPENVDAHWGLSGVLEIRQTMIQELERLQKKKKRTVDPSAFSILQTPQGLDWYELEKSDERKLGSVAVDVAIPNLWHKRSGWLDPTALITRLLNTQGITFSGSTKITKIVKNNDSHLAPNSWKLVGTRLNADLLDLESQIWDQVIVANARGASELLVPLMNEEIGEFGISEALPQPKEERVHPVQRLLQSTYGQLTYGEAPDRLFQNLPQYPINGEGSFLVRPQNQTGMTRWYTGSTFERVDSNPPLGIFPETGAELNNVSTLKRHALNLEKLKALCPQAYAALTTHLQISQDLNVVNGLESWSQWRCNTLNRLPWAQNFTSHLSGLSVLVGLGSKGLALAPLCAEMLACSINIDPSPIYGNLQKNRSKINY